MLKLLAPSPALSPLCWPNKRRSQKLLHSGMRKVDFPRATYYEESPVEPPNAVRWRNLMQFGLKTRTSSIPGTSWSGEGWFLGIINKQASFF